MLRPCVAAHNKLTSPELVLLYQSAMVEVGEVARRVVIVISSMLAAVRAMRPRGKETRRSI